MPNPNNASINLAISSFAPNSAAAPLGSGSPPAPYCPVASLTFATDGSGNPINASGQVALSGMTISVSRAAGGNYPIPLTFNISGPGGINYNPQAIVFVQSNLNGDPDGSTNFTDHNPSNQSITVKNQWRHHGKKHSPGGGNQAPAWKFYIQILNTGTNQSGWIDPTVENTDS